MVHGPARKGADRVILPEQETGMHIAQMLHNPLVRDYVSLGNGFHIVNIMAPERLLGRTVGALKLAERFELRRLGLMRGAEFVDCASGETEIRAEDRQLLGQRPNLRKFADAI
jgi:trk system potassium uptake protein TrkA